MVSSGSVGEKQLCGWSSPILINAAEAEILQALRKRGKILRSENPFITGWSTAKQSPGMAGLVKNLCTSDTGESTPEEGRTSRLLHSHSDGGEKIFKTSVRFFRIFNFTLDL